MEPDPKDRPAPLIDRIKRQIALQGPIGIGEYMSICLSDPHAGYYTTRTPFGRGGDFITAPEVSQIFGELIGIWCVSMWRNMGEPTRFNLVELGPGRGVLMADLVRASSIAPDFRNAAKIRLIEISQPLRDQQAEALAAFDVDVSWHSDVQSTEQIPTIFIGNEFLDALAFHQYVKMGNHWIERVVGIAEDALCYSAGHGIFDKRELPQTHENQLDGGVFETSPAREAVAEFISQHLAENSGAALLIDYGHLEQGFGDTFQAIADHQYTDPLQTPGKADLTSHVDFSALCKYFDGYGSCKLTTQAEFLLNLGLLERAGSLGNAKSLKEQRDIEQAVERLAGDGAMGSLFKVLIAASDGVELVGV